MRGFVVFVLWLFSSLSNSFISYLVFGVLVSCNDILVMFLSTRLVLLLLLLLLLYRGVLFWMNNMATMKSLGVII